jgi:Raf kinase inhibitor-like YbhB/YbcL family protein
MEDLVMAFKLESTAFAGGSTIPAQYTCRGKDRSPPLHWSGAPKGTKSFALICEDPDAPGGVFHHWGLYDLASSRQSIEEGFGNAASPEDGKTVTNDFGSAGYRGPCPPIGHEAHHYHFRLFALSKTELSGPKPRDCRNLAAEIRPHVIGSAEIVGTFSR